MALNQKYCELNNNIIGRRPFWSRVKNRKYVVSRRNVIFFNARKEKLLQIVANYLLLHQIERDKTILCHSFCGLD